MKAFPMAAAALLALAAASAEASDRVYGGRASEQYRSAYEDPRYRDIYGAPDRRTAPSYDDRYAYRGEPSARYPSAPPAYDSDDGYDQNGHGQNGYRRDGYDPNGHSQNGYGPNGYAQHGYGRDPDDPKRLTPPPRHYGYGAPRPVHPPVAYHHGCAPREEVRHRLASQGWHSFRELDIRPQVVVVEARRPHGFPYRLHIDRCSGEIVKARPAGFGRYYARPYPYSYYVRPHVVLPRPHVSLIIR